MTRITGIPTLPGATIRVRVSAPFYQRGDAADPGGHTGTWDGTDVKDDQGNIINLVMPRKDQGDPVINAATTVFITYAFASGKDFVQKVVYTPAQWAETTPGLLDLSKNPDPNAPQLATVEQLQRLSNLLADGAALTAQQRQALADNAQERQLSAAAAAEALGTAGITAAYISDTTADPPAAPEGTYGAKWTVSGLWQRLRRTAGAWVASGSPLVTLLGIQLRQGINLADAPYNLTSGGDLAAALEQAIANVPAGGVINVPAYDVPFAWSHEVALPEDKAVRILGQDWNRVRAVASAPMRAMVYKGNGYVFGSEISNIELDANRQADYVMRGLNSKKFKFNRVKFKNAVIRNVEFGGGNHLWYECQFSEVEIRNEAALYPDPADLPAYGLYLGPGATDSHYRDVVISNAKTAGLYAHGGNNQCHLVHHYGYPFTHISDYGFQIRGDTTLTQCYADGWKLAGIYLVDGAFNNIISGNILFQSANDYIIAPPIRMGANCTNNAVIGNVGKNTTFNGMVQHDNPDGTPGRYNTVFGNTDNNFASRLDNYLRGSLNISSGDNASQPASLTLNSRPESSAAGRLIWAQNWLNIWKWEKEQTALGTNNVGADLVLTAFDNAGSSLGEVIRISRRYRNVRFNGGSVIFGASPQAESPSGTALGYSLTTAGTSKWDVRKDSTANSATLGEHLEIVSRNEDGSYRQTPLKINRETGRISLLDVGMNTGSAAALTLVNATKASRYVLQPEDAESTGNAGSNLVLRSYADDGASSTVLLKLFRSLGQLDISAKVKFNDRVGFYGANPVAKPTVSGSRGGNAALASLITALSTLGLITDNSTS